MVENNNVELVGKITSKFSFSHEVCGEKFYTFSLSVLRSSNTEDKINVLISEKLISTLDDLTGKIVGIDGSIRTYNQHYNEKTKLLINVFADSIDILDSDELHYNSVRLEGFICKKLPVRKTPLGRTICDSIIAINRPYGKTDYCPIITWGRNAIFLDSCNIGDRIKIYGRLQSRIYLKNNIEHTAYEVSVNDFEIG